MPYGILVNIDQPGVVGKANNLVSHKKGLHFHSTRPNSLFSAKAVHAVNLAESSGRSSLRIGKGITKEEEASAVKVLKKMLE